MCGYMSFWWAIDIWAIKKNYTVDIWATTFQLKSMWTIKRSSQSSPVLTCKVLHEFVLVKQLLFLLFSQDGDQCKGNK